MGIRIPIAAASKVLAVLSVGVACATNAANAPLKVIPAQEFEQAVRNIGVRLPGTWRELPERISGVREFVTTARTGAANAPAARMTLTVEVRLDASEAVARLREIDAENPEPGTYLEIGGWPALQRIAAVPESLPGQVNRTDGPPMVAKVTTAIAVGDKVYRLQGQMQRNIDRLVADEMLTIGRQVALGNVRTAGAAKAAVEQLQAAPRIGYGPSPSSFRVESPLKASSANATPGAKSAPGLTLRLANLGNANSEISIAMSNDGKYVVVGSNSRDFRTSSDGGKTFPTSGTVPAPAGAGANGDPSIAFGASGAFYFGYIGFPAAVAGNNRCSTAIARSTNNGSSFAFVTDAITCTDTAGPQCFPDQEHIAADHANLASGGGDRVYSTWRNFSGGGCGGTGVASAGPVIPTLICSSDSAATWPTTRQVGNSGDEFPRVSVGQDGSVYVVYRASNNIMLDKFSACESGLNRVAGFPHTVAAAVTDPTCNTSGAIPGLDRCNGRNTLSSHTVAVDDTDANHVFVGYATNTSAGQNEAIMVQDSTDGGATWPAARSVRADSGTTARRFMPWVCTTGGKAYLSWYDMRFAVPGLGGSGQPNDRADFFGGSVFVNSGGTLVSGGEFRISEVSDALCASGWPAATNNSFDSETCGVQPQLAGICQNQLTPPVNQAGANRCDFSDCGGAGNNAGGACTCTAGGTPATNFVCNIGRGAPKYGDYNYAACSNGRFVAAWASATSPPSITPPSTGIDTFTKAMVVSSVPELQVSPVVFGNTCSAANKELNVCNTGKSDLVVDSISSNNASFSVDTPSAGYSVTISPDFCFPFQARYSSGAAGTVSGLFTIRSNDPINPQQNVAVSAVQGAPSLNATFANSGSFGDVCRGDQADLNLQLVNQGTCAAQVNSIVSPDSHFVLSGVTTFPLTIGAGGTVNIPIRFQAGANEACGVTINSTVTVNATGLAPLVVPVSATIPCPKLVIDPSSLSGINAFPPTVVDTTRVLGCFSEKTVTLRNTGKCALTISNVTATAPNFQVVAPTLFPVTIAPAGALDARVRFLPQSDANAHAPNEVLGTLTIASSDPNTAGTAPMCGESIAQAGIRALVVDITSGTPVPISSLDRLTLMSKGKNTPSPISIRLTDVGVSTANVCGRTVKWHMDEETLPTAQTTGSNPKASYQIDAKEGKYQTSESFELGQCEFKEFTLQLKVSK